MTTDKQARAAAEAFERYRVEQGQIAGMPGLKSRPSFMAGYKAGAESSAPLPKVAGLTEREAFEAWIRGCDGHPFAGQFANLMWKAWQARAAFIATPDSAVSREALFATIHAALMDHGLSFTEDTGSGEKFPLVDKLCAPGDDTIQTGKDEITILAETILDVIPDFAAPAATRASDMGQDDVSEDCPHDTCNVAACQCLTTRAHGAVTDDDDSILCCLSDLEHSAIYDTPKEIPECIRAVVKRIRAILAAPAQGSDAGLVSRIQEASRKAAQEQGAQAGGAREPYIVGNQYRTQSGDLVRFVKVHNAGTSYETMEDEQGVNRYTQRDFGRCTGSAHDYSDPRNTPPLFAAMSGDHPKAEGGGNV